MRIYIGDVMYNIDRKELEAAKKISVKSLESIKKVCGASEDAERLYIATLVMNMALSEQILSKLTSEELEKLFQIEEVDTPHS